MLSTLAKVRAGELRGHGPIGNIFEILLLTPNPLFFRGPYSQSTVNVDHVFFLIFLE